MINFKCILSKRPTATRINFRRLALVSVILYLILPRLAAGQPLNIITDPYPPLGYVKDGEIVGCTVAGIRGTLQTDKLEKFDDYLSSNIGMPLNLLRQMA